MEARTLVDSLVDLTTFELLERIGGSGSLSAAAEAMGVSQQAASARIGRAERRLGVRLLRRGTSGSHLTEQGGMVLEWAAPVLDAARRAAVSLDALRRQDAPLAVAASQTVAEFLLPGWLHRLRDLDPDSVVHLMSGNSAGVVDRVRAGAAQLGFVEGPEVPADLQGAPVEVDELVLVVAPGDRWAGGALVAAAEVAGRPLLVREAGSGTRAVFERWLQARGLAPAAPAAELGTTSAIRAAAAAGVAPAVLSARAVRDDVAAGRLVRVGLLEEGPRRTIAAIWTAPDLSGTARTLLEVARRR